MSTSSVALPTKSVLSAPVVPFEPSSQYSFLNHRHDSTTSRQLGGSGDDDLFVDPETGESYPAYSLSWRYLGLFLDCSNNNNNNRRLDDNNGCVRQVLWAAYHDKGYRGGGIGEYKIFSRISADSSRRSYDGSTCRAQFWWPFTRCRKLNCHEAGTRLQLLGVYKETAGLYDWSEQLFKHQGYCMWNEDQIQNQESASGDNDDDNGLSDYEFMQNNLETWTSGCVQLDYTHPKTGNTLYRDTKPLSGGNMEIGVYSDSSCMTESSLTWTKYVETYYNNNDDDGNGENAQYSASSWPNSVDRWNDLLGDYKVCQPCRAYSRVREVYEKGSHDNGSGSNDYNEDGDDGEGGKERWGFNCYDDAGYTNANQCYKFQTQTDLELASVSDLEEATKQGTILAVKVDGKRYGHGHYRGPGQGAKAFKNASMLIFSTSILAGFAYFYYKKYWSRQKVGSSDMKETLSVISHDDFIDMDDHHFDKRKTSSRAKKDESDPPAENEKHYAGIYTNSTSSREAMLQAQIEERDAKLSKQQALIAKLQRDLESYKKSPPRETDHRGQPCASSMSSSSSSSSDSSSSSSSSSSRKQRQPRRKRPLRKLV